MTHERLHTFTLMEGEVALNTIDLAGVHNAPGLFDDVAQRCRLVLTNKKRLVFTQVSSRALP